jgi:hypothetical protein
LIAGGDPTQFLASVRAIVEKLRAGGTFMRALALASAESPMTDALTAPADTFSALNVPIAEADDFGAPADAASNLAVQFNDMGDALTPPTDSAAGQVTGTLDDGLGGVLVDEDGAAILASLAPLFV